MVTHSSVEKDAFAPSTPMTGQSENSFTLWVAAVLQYFSVSSVGRIDYRIDYRQQEFRQREH